ncbi:rab effector MyRIP-like isoform X1 [Salmo trutta]|uniref:rab effector MyRIP-like isoform X1 n=1 Tax=Salmo trutta TaxID=8032 RepID=UPI0011315AD5|nr:rab effector MyRIP-like isoform X1 [Salmo trutta]XP_029556489.1 rab effector MyRIP-like isoform X1 [Salmo trutta]
MGRKLDLSGLTDDEAEHVLKVVQRDMKLRKKEEDRLSEMKQELAEEGSRCSILSKQHRFNEHCCIRCCSPFTFLVNPKRLCLDCQYNICKTCRTYSKREKGWLCTVCQKTRILRTQSLEWYYNNVKSRFKRFGSAKVLKTLYRNHVVERGGILDLPESSVHDGSNDNDGSVCGSDSTFYRQSEGHSMAETLTVALRVAEEAIEEAIANAEEFSDSLEKQNEARYLRDHKEELIEELATTIVQKIIQRRKHSEMQTEYDFVWPQRQSQGQPQGSELSSPSQHPHSTMAQANQAHLKSSYSLWRSRSAFSLTSDDSPEKVTEALMGAGGGVQDYASLKKETARASSLPSWKSVDRLDNSSASSVLQSPDGNWIALQSSQHSRPSLLAKRKSLVFSVLEKESGVVLAYDEMGSDSDQENDEGGWGSALRQFRRKLSDETYYTDSQHDPEWTYTPVHLPVTSPSSGQYTNTETINSDSESSSVPSSRPRKLLHNVMGKKGPNSDPHLHPQQAQYHHHHHHQHQNFPSYPLHPEALDVNFNPKVTGDSSEAEDSMQSDQVRRSRRRRKNKREAAGNQAHTQTHTQPLYAQSVQENSFLLNGLLKRGMSEEMAAPDVVPIPKASSEAMTPEDQDTVGPNSAARNPMTPDPLSTSSTGPGSGDTLEQKFSSKLSQLVGRANSKEVVSSSEDEPIKSPGGRDRESDRPKEKLRQNAREGDRQRQSERPRDRPSSKSQDGAKRETIESVEGPELENRERLMERQTLREEERVKERRLGRGGKSLEEKVDDREEKRVEKNRQSKRPQRKEVDRKTEKKGEQVEDQNEKSVSTPISLVITPSVQEEVLCDGQEGQNWLELQQRLQLLSSLLQQKYSAASLCSITTEVLKVLNATEELIGEAGGDSVTPSECMSASESFSSSLETRELDQKLTKMEENVYLAAGAVYGLEGALGDLEEVARDISSDTSDRELAFLEDQVATAATQVQQSELQISDIEVRILSLKTAGLNVTACNRFSKFPKPKPKPQTLDTSRQQRRKLPAPPAKDKESEQQVRALQP